jgi:hypothetical protein
MHNSIDFTDLGNLEITFSGLSLNIESTGKAVSLVAAGTVGFGSEDDPIIGQVQNYESDNRVGVRIRGTAELPAAAKYTAGTRVRISGSGTIKDGGTSDAIVIDDRHYGADGTLTVWLR